MRTECLMLTAALVAASAQAQMQASPYADLRVDHDSNVFDFENAAEALQLSGSSKRADTRERAVAGLDWRYALGDARLRGQAEGRRVNYQRFDQLDRNEYRLSTGLDWSPRTSFEGLVEASSERRLASVADRNTTEAFMENERSGRAALRMRPGSRWQLEAEVAGRRLHSPLPLAPDFALDERSANGSIRRLLAGDASVGFFAQAIDGDFSGIEGNDAFRQYSGEADAHYGENGPTRILARFGHSVRIPDARDRDKLRAFTGSLSLQRELSPLTSVELSAYRRLESFTAGADALLARGVRVSLNWQRQQLGLSAGGQWSWASFQSQSADPVDGREDRIRSMFLRGRYHLLRYVSFEPYYEYRQRASNVAFQDYSGNIVGVELSARFGAGAPDPSTP